MSKLPTIEVERQTEFPHRIQRVWVDGNEVRGVCEVHTSWTVDDVPTTTLVLLGSPEYVVPEFQREASA